MAVRLFAPWADPLMLPLAAVLNGLGIVMIYRLQEFGSNGNGGLQISTLTTHAALYQLMWTAVGIVAFVVVLLVIREPRVLKRYTYTLGTIGVILLAIPAVLPDSHSSVQGAKVWIIFGGFSIQPGEFARIALAVFFAGYLVSKRDVLSLAGRRVLGIDLPRARDMGPILVLWAASLLILVFEYDIGQSALFFGLFVAMLYIATQRTSWLLIGIILFLFGAELASMLFGHVNQRFAVWLHPFSHANVDSGLSYQPVQGLEGMAFGGIFGTGLGLGEPFRTPLVQSDFIFTGFGEELGLTGLMAMLLIFGLLVQRGLRAAIAVRDPFAKLLAGGPRLRDRAAGLHHRRRRDRADPADRRHDAVPVPGRLVAGGELDRDRAADAGQRQRAPSRAAADPGRGPDPGGAGGMNQACAGCRSPAW